ncbi:MAG: class I tRNA ligase family protein, partial [Saprospiraceae bacterium]
MEYSPQEIEPKWRQWWQAQQTYRVPNNSTKPKYYLLNMFPYPSGAGLHVGHPLGYIASDILARYKRLRGYNVLNPMGYDSFGLPAEQYAIQTGNHPQVATDQNITRFREQLDEIGLSFDWSREVRTSDPKFYKWTQWIFMRLFEHYYDLDADKALPITQLGARFASAGNTGVRAVCDDDMPVFSATDWNAWDDQSRQRILLKYRLTYPGEAYVNWCPALGSVLSNDEVKDGVSERGGHPVERKMMNQWNMRITAYADRLLEGLHEIDWPDSIKEQQRNWIGRSVGASVRFDVAGHPEARIEVFTTRVDTIFGVTFLVLAPEHELVTTLTTDKQRLAIAAYEDWAGARSDVERMADTKKVTGAFTGSYALHPFSGEKIPIYIADYVLAGYGTGAVMAVPSGDQRDWDFAKHFRLPIVPILDAQQGLDEAADPTKEGRYVNSGLITGLAYAEAVPLLINHLETNGLGKGKTQYKLRAAVFSRQRYWGEPVPAYWHDGLPYLIDDEDLPLVLPAVDKYLPTETGEPPLARAKDWSYVPHAAPAALELPDEELSLQELEENTGISITPPPFKSVQIEPFAGDKAPNTAVRSLGKSAAPAGGPLELSTMPGWAGSSWYFYRYMDPQNDAAFCSPEALRYWQAVDVYLGGAEHAVGHLLYSRFWNHFMYDLGLVPEREFAKKLINQGMIQGRSNFVFRAKESFFELYLWQEVLRPFFDEEGPIAQSTSGSEEGYKYDFAFGANNLVVEVTSYKQQEKIERIRRSAEADGKRLLVLSTEELTDAINDPQVTVAKIRAALDSREIFTAMREKPRCEQLYVSYSLLPHFDAEALTKLHVDVYLVDNDVLDVEKASTKPQFDKANFKVDSEGRFTCSFEVEKMSKSKYNVVNPDDMVQAYGADCFRMYEMFLGPVENSKPWNTSGITGVAGFLRKFWGLF